MAKPDKHRVFVPWFSALFIVVALGGLWAATTFYGMYAAVEDDPERSEQLMRFVVVGVLAAPVILLLRWFAIRGRTKED
jgi:fatty acid desaturase